MGEKSTGRIGGRGEPPVTIIRDNDGSGSGPDGAGDFVDLTKSGSVTGGDGDDTGNDTGNSGTGNAPGGNGADTAAPYGFRADGQPAKKRGRKPGSGSSGASAGSPKRSANSVSVNGVNKILLSLHMMGEAALKMPELAIDKQEAELLGSAIQAVQDHYNFDVSEEVTLWVNLVTAAVAVYGPRAVAIIARKKKESSGKEEKEQILPAARKGQTDTAQEFVDTALDKILNPGKYN